MSRGSARVKEYVSCLDMPGKHNRVSGSQIWTPGLNIRARLLVGMRCTCVALGGEELGKRNLKPANHAFTAPHRITQYA